MVSKKAMKKKLLATKKQVVAKANKELVVMKAKFKKAESHVKGKIKQNPEKAVLIAAGIGAAVGAAIGAGITAAMKKKKRR